MRSPVVGMAVGQSQTASQIHSEPSMVADNSGSLLDWPVVMAHAVLVMRQPSELLAEVATYHQSANTKYMTEH